MRLFSPAVKLFEGRIRVQLLELADVSALDDLLPGKESLETKENVFLQGCIHLLT